MTKFATGKSAEINRLTQKNALLEKRIDALLEKVEELTVALATERQMQAAAARRRSYGNGLHR